MNTLFRLSKSIAIDAVIAYLIYLWKFSGNEGVGNVVTFFFWLVAIAGILVAFLPAEGKRKPRIKILESYDQAIDFLFVLTFVYFEHFLLAALLISGVIGANIFRGRFDDEGNPKLKDAK